MALAGVAGEFEGTSLEFIPNVGPFEQWAVDLMTDMSSAAQRALNWNVMAVTAGNLQDCLTKLEAGDYARKHGGKVVALTIPMSFPVRLSFKSGFVLDAMPGLGGRRCSCRSTRSWRCSATTSPPRQLNEQAQSDANALPEPRALGEHDRLRRRSLPRTSSTAGGRSARSPTTEGRDPWDVLCDIALADELNTSFGTPPPVETDDDWEARLEVWRDGRAVIGASDAGAHLDLLASFNYTTVVLGQAVRERGLLPLEEAVHLITDVPAQLYGLKRPRPPRRGRTTPTSSCSTRPRSRATRCGCASTSPVAPAGSTPRRRGSSTCS